MIPSSFVSRHKSNGILLFGLLVRRGLNGTGLLSTLNLNLICGLSTLRPCTKILFLFTCELSLESDTKALGITDRLLFLKAPFNVSILWFCKYKFTNIDKYNYLYTNPLLFITYYLLVLLMKKNRIKFTKRSKIVSFPSSISSNWWSASLFLILPGIFWFFNNADIL